MAAYTEYRTLIEGEIKTQVTQGPTDERTIQRKITFGFSFSHVCTGDRVQSTRTYTIVHVYYRLYLYTLSMTQTGMGKDN